jgi:CcmD family protein
MIKRLSWFFGLLLAFLFTGTVTVYAQQNNQPAMADLMRSNGKIYVVVAVLVIIFIGIVLYLIRLDRKISRLEKRGQIHSS